MKTQYHVSYSLHNILSDVNHVEILCKTFKVSI